MSLPLPEPEGPTDLSLSVIVVCYEMRRELRRTLLSLSSGYQRGIAADDYEVILVDNGSADPPTLDEFADLGINLRILHHPGAGPSPVPAMNAALALCRGRTIGLLIDGARVVTPGLLNACLQASRIHDKAVIYTLSLHLGWGPQFKTIHEGYSQAIEDQLLQSINWPADGYRLYDIAYGRRDPSQWSAKDAPVETDGLFMPAALWRELGGYDPGFVSIGAGWASGDMFLRACEAPGVQVVMISGEATVHQMHEKSAASASRDMQPRLQYASREYHSLRKKALRPYRGPFWVFGLGRARNPRNEGFVGRPPRTLYLDLLKQTLLAAHEMEVNERALRVAEAGSDGAAKAPPAKRRSKMAVERGVKGGAPTSAYTMLGQKRLDSLASQLETVIADGVPGDVIECGVWRGGACILMAGILSSHGVNDRRVWVADSFAGLPPPGPEDEGVDISAQHHPWLAVDVETVRGNFERFGLLNDQVQFLKGWFCDTLPSAPIQQLAILRLDGDLYSSTMDVLEALYDKVSSGGFVIIDDYGAFPQCARAVHDFRARHGVTEPMHKIDWTGWYWRKA